MCARGLTFGGLWVEADFLGCWAFFLSNLASTTGLWALVLDLLLPDMLANNITTYE